MPSTRFGRWWLWTLLVLVAAGAAYEFWPDGSSSAGVPAYAPARVRRAMARLNSRRPGRRCAAANELGRLHAGAAVQRLVELLADEEESMGRLERAAQSLMFGALTRPVWSCAATALEQIGAAANIELDDAIRGGTPPVRVRAARIMAATGGGFLSMHADDPDPAIRQAALTGIARFEDFPYKVMAIRRAFHDPDPDVRIVAIGCAEPEMGPEVHAHLVALSVEDPDQRVRQRAADRLRFWGR